MGGEWSRPRVGERRLGSGERGVTVTQKELEFSDLRGGGRGLCGSARHQISCEELLKYLVASRTLTTPAWCSETIHCSADARRALLRGESGARARFE